jgi:glycosyltransferase involved in cell wall biosynthesis
LSQPGDVALVADYLIFLRGAERTFAQIAACWPAAPIYTIAYRRRATDDRFVGRDIRTSFLQRFGLNRRWYRKALPLLTRAAQSLPVDGHAVVVSSSFGFAHGVRTGESAVHVCYCHSPFRQAWHERGRALDSVPSWARFYAARSLERYRRWDREAARHVTRYVANSEITRERIAELYGHDAPVVHPPVEVERFAVHEPEDYFLYVGELVSHKRPAVALEAAHLSGSPIVVVGDGPDLSALRARFPRARFVGRIDDRELADVYARCRALVLPNVEEFGIAAVEAQAAGRPVLGLAKGGALETVIDGRTGVLVEGEEARGFAEAMRHVDFDRFAPAEMRRNARRFSADRFRRGLRALVEEASANAG